MREERKQIVWDALATLYVLIGLQVATQIFAWVFQYHPTLGANIDRIYPFWKIISWYCDWCFIYPRELQLAILGFGFVLFVLFFFTFELPKSVGLKKEKESDLYGSSHFANKKDIIKANLLPKNQKEAEKSAVIVGGWIEKKWWGKKIFHLLRHSGPEHILMMAPTRSGKGVSVVIPTLLSWKESLVVTDLKGELWACTSGWRKNYGGNKVLKFEPASENSVHWNPLDSIRIGPKEIADAQNIARLIIDPDGEGLKDHWMKTADSLITGVILYLLHEEKDFHNGVATLPRILSTLSEAEQEKFEHRIDKSKCNLWDSMMSYQGMQNNVSAQAIFETAADIVATPPEERGSIISTAKSALTLYRDPIVAKNISSSDFLVKDLMNSEDPVSLYVITQPNDKDRLRPLVRVIINGITRLLADKMVYREGRAFGDYKHRMLLMLDEFPSLGRLPIIEESLAYVAGYGIKCCLICQDMTQLRKSYGQQEAISANCHIHIVFAPNTPDTAEYISKRIGRTTIVKEEGEGKSHRTQYYQRDLLTPDEVTRLKKVNFKKNGKVDQFGEILVMVAGCPPIKGSQPLYYIDQYFSVRAKIPAPETSDTL